MGNLEQIIARIFNPPPNLEPNVDDVFISRQHETVISASFRAAAYGQGPCILDVHNLTGLDGRGQMELQALLNRIHILTKALDHSLFTGINDVNTCCSPA